MSLEGGQAGLPGPLGTINPKKDCRRRAGRGGRSAEPRERAVTERTRGLRGRGGECTELWGSQSYSSLLCLGASEL